MRVADADMNRQAAAAVADAVETAMIAVIPTTAAVAAADNRAEVYLQIS